MKQVFLILISFICITVVTANPSFSKREAALNLINESTSYSNSSLSYIPNRGQFIDTDGNPRPDIKYMVEGKGIKVYFRETGLSYVFAKTDSMRQYNRANDINSGSEGIYNDSKINAQIEMHRVDIDFIDAGPSTHIIELDTQQAYKNYYLANCPKGITKVKTYGKIIYKNIYPNVDWILYNENGRLKYDLMVHKSGDLSKIKMKISGHKKVRLTTEGDLEITTPLGFVTEKNPVVFQDGDQIESHYTLNNDIVHFVIPEFVPQIDLLIDPTREWATFYGGTDTDVGEGGIATDNLGNIYVHGSTRSLDFPVTPGAYQSNSKGGTSTYPYDSYLMKFSETGNLHWATYYGGSSTEWGTGGCLVDNIGDIYFHGMTYSSDFPVTNDVFQDTLTGDADCYFVKLNKEGVRIWSTLYGGSKTEYSNSCSISRSGRIYGVGSTYSSNFPVTNGSFQDSISGNYDTYIFSLDSTGNYLWSTYLGGKYFDGGYQCTVDSSGNLLISGTSESTDFPVSSNAFQKINKGSSDAFLAKFDSLGNYQWSTYFGGTRHETGSGGCAIDFESNIILFGMTWSEDLPISKGALDSISDRSRGDAFIAKFRPNGSLVWSTYFGGSYYEHVDPDNDGGRGGCAIDDSGNIYIHGTTQSRFDLPITSNAFQSEFAGAHDIFIAMINPNGKLLWSTYYGGSFYDYSSGGCSIDNKNKLVIHGRTRSSNFPVSNNAFKDTLNYAGRWPSDGYIVKFNPYGNPSGVSETWFSQEESVNIFPNPTKDKVYIQFRKDQKYLRVQVRNVMGQLVRSEVSYNINSQSIDIPKPAGIYFITVKSNKKRIQTFKIVKK